MLINRHNAKNQYYTLLHTPFSSNNTFSPGFTLKISEIRYNVPQIKAGFWQQVICSNLFTNAFTLFSATSAFKDL